MHSWTRKFKIKVKIFWPSCRVSLWTIKKTTDPMSEPKTEWKNVGNSLIIKQTTAIKEANRITNSMIKKSKRLFSKAPTKGSRRTQARLGSLRQGNPDIHRTWTQEASHGYRGAGAQRSPASLDSRHRTSSKPYLMSGRTHASRYRNQ